MFFGVGIPSDWRPDGTVELLLYYAATTYLIVIVLALGLWVWSRLMAPKQPPTSTFGAQVHADAWQQVRTSRNRFLLVLLPILVLMTGLPIVHPIFAVVMIAAFATVAFVVFRDTYRFLAGTT